MDRPSYSRDPLLTREGGSESDGGESVEMHAHEDDPNVGETVCFTDVDEDQPLTPISESTVVEGVDANVLKLPRENQKFLFVEFSPDWKLVVTVTSDGTFSVWDATNEWVLVGLKRLHHDGRTLKCIAFDPYNDKAILLCFDSGEVFRANLRELAAVDAPRSCQDRAVFHLEFVHKCEGRSESRFDHFTFSPRKKMMVYYNTDGIFSAAWFHEQGVHRHAMLSRDFIVRQDVKVYICQRHVLITAILRSSEDREPTSERLETLVLPEYWHAGTDCHRQHVRLEGKGYSSDDGEYVLVSKLAAKHSSTSCQIDVYRSIDIQYSTTEKPRTSATRSLKFVSNYPHLECLDWNMFNFLNVNHAKTKPLIAICQTNSVGSRLMFLDINSDALIYEIDLTLDKGAQRFSEVKYCWSSDCKWLGVCSVDDRMIGLVCVRSGVLVWTSHVQQISREDTGFCTLRFDPSGSRLMISIGKLIYLIEPPCLLVKPQKHPMNDNLLFSHDSRRHSDFEILEMAKEWPKQVLFSVLMAGQKANQEYQQLLLDVSLSLTSQRLAMICKKYEGFCFLHVLDYSESSSWESLWLAAMSKWNRCVFGNNTSSLVKEIKGDREYKGLSVFYYPNEESGNEQIILLSSKSGVEMLDLDSDLNEMSEWTTLSNEICFSFTQSKDRRSVISLANGHVLIVDLNKKLIVKSVEYSFGLSQWWESFLDGIKFFAYSQYANFDGQEFGTRHKLFLQDRLRGIFDVSEDGETILIGWDIVRNRGLVITPDKREEQFRTEWNEVHETLYQCSMLTRDGQWLGFIDFEKLRGGDIVVCVENAKSNRQQRIWLGSNELLAKPSSESQPLVTKFFLQLDEAKEKLTILDLKEIGPQNKFKQFFVELVHDVEHVQDHQSLLEVMTKPTNMDKRDQPSIFNMSVANISNFQRVLAEEGEDAIKEVAKCALENKVKISNVYRFCQEKAHGYTTFLNYAQEMKETTLVQLCLRFIQDGLFTFDSASAMVKDSFFEMLFSYNELFLPFLKRDLLTFTVAEIKVPAQIFQSQDAISNVVFTSDTLLEPNEYFVKTAVEEMQKSESAMHLGWTKDHVEGRKVLSFVSFHYISNACKVGLNGIVRKLLMLEVDPSIFKTELIRATITWKWDKLWKRRCLWQLSLYIIFLIFFTLYAFSIGRYGDSLVHDKTGRLRISFLLLGAFILTIVFFIDECRQLKTYLKDGKEVFGSNMWGYKHYFLDSQWNLLELTSYFLVLVLIPIFHCMYIFEVGSKEAFYVIVAIESILAWFKLWYFAQPFDQTGALVLLISNVILDCIPFVVLSLVVLFGFSIALYVLFQSVSIPHSTSTLEEENGGDLIHESFGSLRRSLSTLFYAMVGTFEVEVYYNHQSLPWLTTLIFILYMALEMIVMLNMLIAIMGDTFDKVKIEEDVQIIIGRARFIDAYEASLRTSQIKKIEKQIGKFLYVLIPKDGKYTTKKTNWKGKINVIEKNVKAAIAALGADVMKAIKESQIAIEENKKAINDNKEEMGNKIHQHYHQMESILEKNFEEYKKHEEEYWKKEQDFLLSISERMEALEVETSKLASRVGHQST